MLILSIYALAALIPQRVEELQATTEVTWATINEIRVESN